LEDELERFDEAFSGARHESSIYIAVCALLLNLAHGYGTLWTNC